MDNSVNQNQSKESKYIDDIVNRILKNPNLAAEVKADVATLAYHIFKLNELKRKRLEVTQAEMNAGAGDAHLLKKLQQQEHDGPK